MSDTAVVTAAASEAKLLNRLERVSAELARTRARLATIAQELDAERRARHTLAAELAAERSRIEDPGGQGTVAVLRERLRLERQANSELSRRIEQVLAERHAGRRSRRRVGWPLRRS